MLTFLANKNGISSNNKIFNMLIFNQNYVFKEFLAGVNGQAKQNPLILTQMAVGKTGVVCKSPALCPLNSEAY